MKSILKSGELEQSLRNSYAFKLLRMMIPDESTWDTNNADERRFYRCPPWFVIAYESELTLPTIKNKIEEVATEMAVEFTAIADAVFVLDRGWLHAVMPRILRFQPILIPYLLRAWPRP